MSVNWFEENEGQVELIPPSPAIPEAPAERKKRPGGQRGGGRRRADPEEQARLEKEIEEKAAGRTPAPPVPAPPPLEPKKKEEDWGSAGLNPSAPPIPLPESEAPPLPPPPSAAEPPAPRSKTERDDIPDFAPPPSMLKDKKEEDPCPPEPPIPPVLHPTPAEAQTDAQSEAGGRMAALQRGEEKQSSSGSADDRLLSLSKETGIEVYKYPEKLLLEVPLDVSIVKPRFAESSKKVDLMCQMVEAAQVSNDDEAKELTALLGDMKRLGDAVDEMRLRMTKPYRESSGRINDFANEFVEKLKIHVNRGKQKLLEWQAKKREEEARRKKEEERIAKEAQERLRKQAEEETRRLREEAARQGIDPATVPPVPVPAAPPAPVPERKEKKVKAEGATAYETEEWVCDVYDPEAVPVEYKIYSQKLLDQAVAAGVRAIPGCNIYKRTGMGLRTR